MTKLNTLKNKETVFTNSFLYYLNLIRSIKKSSLHIDISLYTFSLDRTGNYVLQELLKACDRGVRVNMILDGVGSIESYNSIAYKATNKNFSLRVYNPLPWPFSRISLKNPHHKKMRFYFLSRINKRNHTKVFSIDKKTIFIGSHNICNESIFWRETSVQICSTETASTFDTFIFWLWKNSFFLKKTSDEKNLLDPANSNQTLFSYSLKTRRILKRTLIEKIDQSRGAIQITAPYFYPPYQIIKSLCLAAQRGVCVEIMLSKESGVFFFPRVSRVFYSAFLKAGVKIYEYQATTIHAKQFRVDSWASVGSSNLNTRSLFNDIELNYVLSEKNSLNKIIQDFEFDKKQSLAISKSDLGKLKSNWLFNYLLGKLFSRWI